MSTPLKQRSQPPPMAAGALEALLRERTDSFAAARLRVCDRARRDPRLDAGGPLPSAPQAHRCGGRGRISRRGRHGRRCDHAAVDASQRPPRGLARLLRPGGRLIASVPAVAVRALSLLLATGLFTARVHNDDVTILIGVRGILASRRRRAPEAPRPDCRAEGEHGERPYPMPGLAKRSLDHPHQRARGRLGHGEPVTLRA